jgi:hypothetical protein
MAHVLVDYGPEYDLLWVCFQDDTGECWTWSNKDIRAQENITYNRNPEKEDVPFPPLKMTASDVYEEMRRRNSEIAKLELKYRELNNKAFPERREMHTT